MNLKYTFHSGKNSKLKYYIQSYYRYFVPKFFYHVRLNVRLKSISNRNDKDYIFDRVSYYNRLSEGAVLPAEALVLENHTLKNHHTSKAYFFDSYEYTRWFPDKYKWMHKFGDVTVVPEEPSIVKSRPIYGNIANSVVLNLDKLRHFTFIKDKKTFGSKKNMIIFRAYCVNKPHRQRFVEMYANHPMCDVADVDPRSKCSPFYKPKMSLYEHFDYKFIMALEGGDVATNLKWIMWSNSIAVMPRPTYETWFMEGRLIPNYHYIEIKSDYSDLIERCTYYINHPDEAQNIIKNARSFVKQFFNHSREHLISLLVLDKYFKMTGQK